MANCFSNALTVSLNALTVCPYALTFCSNALTDWSYDLTVDSYQLVYLTFDFNFTSKRKSPVMNLIWHKSFLRPGKWLAILNGSLFSPGINCSASISDNHVSRLWTRLQISLIKTEANREQTSSISALFLKLLVNNFLKQIYVDIIFEPIATISIGWQPKGELCCILLTSNNSTIEVTLFVEQTSRQINFCQKILTICFFFVEETFDHVLGNEIDHVSPMFISEHQCKYGMQTNFLQILFFNSPNKFFSNTKKFV